MPVSYSTALEEQWLKCEPAEFPNLYAPRRSLFFSDLEATVSILKVRICCQKLAVWTVDRDFDVSEKECPPVECQTGAVWIGNLDYESILRQILEAGTGNVVFFGGLDVRFDTPPKQLEQFADVAFRSCFDPVEALSSLIHHNALTPFYRIRPCGTLAGRRRQMQPMLDPKRDLAGATPETLARALFRPLRGWPRPARQPVVGDQLAVEEVPADEPPDGVTHLGESP